jgi:hypothetical protein
MVSSARGPVVVISSLGRWGVTTINTQEQVCCGLTPWRSGVPTGDQKLLTLPCKSVDSPPSGRFLPVLYRLAPKVLDALVVRLAPVDLSATNLQRARFEFANL